jgi:hypothetical protein
MFVIPCKYSAEACFIFDLVSDIKKYHPGEKIIVIDSSSQDKTYFTLLKKEGVIVEDIGNTNWCIGAYWYAYKKYPNEPFYYFMHDSMKVKGSLNDIKNRDLTILCYFDRKICGTFNQWASKIEEHTSLKFNSIGLGCYGPTFFCKNEVMKALLDAGVDKLLPVNKQEIGFAEGAYGFFFEQLGYELPNCSLYGDLMQNESVGGRSGLYPHNTSWQYPIEKFYGHHYTSERL